MLFQKSLPNKRFPCVVHEIVKKGVHITYSFGVYTLKSSPFMIFILGSLRFDVEGHNFHEWSRFHVICR